MRFLKRCWQRRLIRGFAWTLITLFTLIALVTVWVDWYGARRLRKVKAALAGKGQSFDLRDASPDPIPDADNFCAIPLLKNLILASDGDGTTSGPARNRCDCRTPRSFFPPRGSPRGQAHTEAETSPRRPRSPAYRPDNSPI